MITDRLNKLEGRISARSFLALKNIAYSLGVKGLSIIVGLLILPVYSRFLLNQSVLGIWLTLISMLTWIFTFDLGIGNGLRNHVAEAYAKNDRHRLKTLISSAYISVIFLCVLLGIIVFLGLKFVDFISIFHIDKSVIDSGVLNISIRLLVVSILIQFVLKLISSVLLALHKSAIPNVIVLATNLLLLLFMVIMPVSTINNNFLALSIVYIFATNVPLLVASFLVFSKDLKDCRPSFRFFKVAEAKQITKLGFVFLWLQIMAMIISQTNNFLVGIFVGAADVVPFQIYYKLFSMVSMLFTIAMTPIWSSITDAKAKNDFLWILNVRRKLYIFLGLAVFGEIAIIFISKFIITIWMGSDYIISNLWIVATVAIFDLITIWSSINASIGNGLAKLKNQMIFLTIGAVINFPLSWMFSTVNHSWIAIVIANIISLLPYCISETISTNSYLRDRAKLTI